MTHPDVSLNELILAFLTHAKTHCRRADGTATNEQMEFRQAFKPLKKLHGESLAAEFGPAKLKAVREAMVEAGICRTLVNRRVLRVRFLFRWAVEQEMVLTTVYHSLKTVIGLQFGRTPAPETDPITPVEA
ncbi:hypothetical protein [Limnoglobus roseus]|uniref:Site-specific integrase n=1 Tax=Limnoglobus roseus TaxID=2598579 RepID=A0A5C1AJJ4_9BACT|nr:hypothetical protein [Limnoglobus roseus]QEL19371.1 site-specific integrase [Limnoglobus roseus]